MGTGLGWPVAELKEGGVGRVRQAREGIFVSLYRFGLCCGLPSYRPSASAGPVRISI